MLETDEFLHIKLSKALFIKNSYNVETTKKPLFILLLPTNFTMDHLTPNAQDGQTAFGILVRER